MRVRRKGPCVTLDFDGDGFLYKMIRLIVGSLVKCALDKLSVEDLTDRLASAQARADRASPLPPKDYSWSASATDDFAGRSFRRREVLRETETGSRVTGRLVKLMRFLSVRSASLK